VEMELLVSCVKGGYLHLAYLGKDRRTNTRKYFEML